MEKGQDHDGIQGKHYASFLAASEKSFLMSKEALILQFAYIPGLLSTNPREEDI
jgi:hypothetical protein